MKLRNSGVERGPTVPGADLAHDMEQLMHSQAAWAVPSYCRRVTEVVEELCDED